MHTRQSQSGRTCVSACVIASMWFGSPAAHAQAQRSELAPTAAPPGGLEEVTVTARMKSESLIAAPVAVTAVSADQLNRNSATDLARIAELAPQVIVTQAQNGGGGAFNIRGIGSSPQDPGIEQSVSINLDGIQLSRGRLVNLSMFDLAQVEVLKGPQALFFGKNSDAGVISLTSAGPTDTFQSVLKAGYEFTADTRFVEAAVSGPLTDALKFRLAGRASQTSGYLYNVSVLQPSPFQGPDLPQPGAADLRQPANRDGNIRLSLAYEPTDALDATLKLLGGKDRGNSGSGAIQILCPSGEVPATLGVPDPTGHCYQPGHLSQIRSVGSLNPQIAATIPGMGDGKPYTRSDLFIGSGKINYRLNHLVLTSVTGYAWLTSAYMDNTSFVTWCEVCSHESERDSIWSEELRLSSEFDFPLNFTVGAYYQNSRTNLFSDFTFGFTPDPVTGGYAAAEHVTDITDKTISPFGQVRWSILENLELSGGVRWTQEEKTIHTANTFVNGLLGFFSLRSANDFMDARQKGINVSPEATLSWHPTPRSTVYAAYKTGYKSGGFSVPGVFTTSYTPANIAYDAERAKGFEIGYKAELLDHRLRFETDAYRYTYSNLQLSSFDTETFSEQIRNAGGARTQGVEGSLEWQVSGPLTVRASLAYNHARYINFDSAQCYQTQPSATVPGLPGTCYNNVQNLAGRPLIRAPDVVGNAGASYDVPIPGNLWIGVHADARYTSAFYPEETLSPYAHVSAFWLVNAGLRVHPQTDQWELALIGTNLTNELYYNQAENFEAGNYNTWAYSVNLERPRELLLQATVRF